MEQIFIFIAVLWCVFITFVMVFAPGRVLAYVKNSRMWGYYLGKVFNIKQSHLSGSTALRYVRLYGMLNVLPALMVLYAWFYSI